MKAHFAEHIVNSIWMFFSITFISVSSVFAQTTVKIMPLGDSIAAGFGSTNSNGYRGPLHGLLTTEGISIDFVGSQSAGVGFPDTDHEGHSGETADFILTNINTYLQTEFSSLGPQEIGIVLLHIGTNNITANEMPESIRDSIGGIIDAVNLFNPNIFVILSSLTPRNDNDGGVKDANNSTLNNFLEELYLNKRNAGFKILYAGMNELFKCNPNWAIDYLGDDVHPTDAGYSLMAAVWFNRIMNAINNTDLTVTDNFERSFLGDMWDADAQYLIQSGDLVNTATTGQERWEYMAVFKGQRSATSSWPTGRLSSRCSDVSPRTSPRCSAPFAGARRIRSSASSPAREIFAKASSKQDRPAASYRRKTAVRRKKTVKAGF